MPSIRSRSLRALVIVAAAAVPSGCRTPPAPVLVPSGHPASPACPEAPPPPLSTALLSDTGAAPPAPESPHDHPATEAKPGDDAGFVCPMHEDVVSRDAGRCPKCGMALVPKA